jgi:hypothetical protein
VWKFWFFLVLFFCQVWLQHLSKIFDLRSSHCLLLPSSRHLGFFMRHMNVSHEIQIIWLDSFCR